MLSVHISKIFSIVEKNIYYVRILQIPYRCQRNMNGLWSRIRSPEDAEA